MCGQFSNVFFFKKKNSMRTCSGITREDLLKKDLDQAVRVWSPGQTDAGNGNREST